MKIAIETVHQWAQKLPMKDGVLVCISCNQHRPIGRPQYDDEMTCAEAAAWRYGCTSRGDFWLVPERVL